MIMNTVFEIIDAKDSGETEMLEYETLWRGSTFYDIKSFFSMKREVAEGYAGAGNLFECKIPREFIDNARIVEDADWSIALSQDRYDDEDVIKIVAGELTNTKWDEYVVISQRAIDAMIVTAYNISDDGPQPLM